MEGKHMESELKPGTLLPPGTKKNKPVDLARFLKRYLLLVVVFGNFIFTLIVPFAFLAIKPFYKVSATIQIDPVTQTIIGKGQETSILQQYTDYIRTQAIQLRSHDILNVAVERLSPDAFNALFPPGINRETAIAIVNARLYIKPIRNTHLIEMAIQGNTRAGLADILNNIMDVYKEQVDTRQKNKNDNRLQFLQSEHSILAEDIKTKIETLRNLARKTYTSNFKEEFNFFYKKAELLQQANVKMSLQLIDVETLYRQKLSEKEEISKLSMEAQVEEVVANDWGLDSTQSWTYQQLQEMRTKLDGLSRDNRDRGYVEERMDAMRKYELEMTEEVRKLAKKTVYGKRDYELETGLISEESKYNAIKKGVEELSAQLEIAKKEATLNSELLITGGQIQEELAHMRQLMFKYEARINELVVQSNAPSRISVALRAMEPTAPAGNNSKKLLMVCLIIPYGMMGCFFFILEWIDNRITSPMNIIHALGVPSTWPIARADADLPFHEIMEASPNSLSAKAMRSLATRIYKEHLQNHSRVFLFNSVDEVSGTSDILLNVSRHLGNLGSRVLIIESVATTTVLKKRFGVSENAPDIGAFLNSETDLDDLLYHDASSGVKILFAPEELDAHHVLRPVFCELLEKFSKEFDLILMDSSPVMKNDFTEHLTVFTDVLVLIIHGNRTLYRNFRRVAELFIRQEVPAIIPVLNWGGPRPDTILGMTFKNPVLRFLMKRINSV